MLKIIKIILGFALMAILFYQYKYNISILVLGFVLMIWLEIFFNTRKQLPLEDKKITQCPCCFAEFKYLKMLKYSLQNIITGENYFYCSKCKKLILNFKFYKIKIFIVTTFIFMLSLVFLIIFEYYILIVIAIILYIILYIHGLTYVPLGCYLDRKDADSKDLIRIELKKEKNIFTLIFILLFLFFLFSIFLKLIEA